MVETRMNTTNLERVTLAKLKWNAYPKFLLQVLANLAAKK
jgi:hypothetical protein